MHKEDRIARLFQQYKDAVNSGKEPYFDADDINSLLDSLEESNDYTYYDEVLALGLKLHPYDTALKVKKCRQIADLEGYSKALSALEKIADIDNQDLDMLRLECYCALNQCPNIFKYMQELRDRDCEYMEEIYEYIAPLLDDFERKDEALEFINQGLKSFPDNLILKDELCYIFESQGKFDQAIKICNELIDKNPFCYEYWYTLGRLYSVTSDFEKAIEAFDYALTCEDSTDTENLKTLRAYCFYMCESYEKAIDAYWELESESDEDTKRTIMPLLAECYMKIGNFEDAYSILSHIINNYGLSEEEGPSLYINLVHCCTETNRDKEVTDLLVKAEALYPNNIRIFSLCLYHLIDKGEIKQAIAIMNGAIDNPGIIGTNKEFIKLVQTGQLYFVNDNLDEAISYFEKAAKIDSQTPTIHILLAITYLKKNDINRFMFHMQKGTNDGVTDFNTQNAFYTSSIDKNPQKAQFIEPIELALEYINNTDNNN